MELDSELRGPPWIHGIVRVLDQLVEQPPPVVTGDLVFLADVLPQPLSARLVDLEVLAADVLEESIFHLYHPRASRRDQATSATGRLPRAHRR